MGQLILPDFGQTMHCGHFQCLHSAAEALIEAAEPSDFVAQMLYSQAAVQRLVFLPAPDADSYRKMTHWAHDVFCAHAVDCDMIGQVAACCKQLCIPSGEVENAFDALDCLPAYARFRLWNYVCQVLPTRVVAQALETSRYRPVVAVPVVKSRGRLFAPDMALQFCLAHDKLQMANFVVV